MSNILAMPKKETTAKPDGKDKAKPDARQVFLHRRRVQVFVPKSELFSFPSTFRNSTIFFLTVSLIPV